MQTYKVTVNQPAPDMLVCFPDHQRRHTEQRGVRAARATVGQQYEGFIITSNNAGGTFSITAGSLPPGLTLSGVPPLSITGTPTATGTFSFAVTATDGTGAKAAETGSIAIS
jgi:hypothetical protein